METLVVRQKDENQLAAIKAFMQALDIDFEQQDGELTKELNNSIIKGISEPDNGDTISFETFKSKHFRAI